MDRPGLKTIFSEAIVLPDGPERAAFLNEACRDDAELRAQVEALLRDHERIGRFLGTATRPIASPGDTARDGPGDPQSGDTTQAEGPDERAVASVEPGSEGTGTVIGPYKLLQQIGEGGMGTVYMAEQTQPVQRTVALKLIKAGMDSRQVLARFGAERQALALMDHPNIATVLDVGTNGAGRPYFVMELVKGTPITRYCDERRLTVRNRLELAIPVCQAVQHAHQKGVIHRDLKPSNVLIALYDGKPVPKVIDFGVAKATGARLTDQTLHTEFGAVVGTLEYMSPEQAELNQLDIDTRSDIYSLGVLLYELLTGSTPLERKRLNGAALFELLRLIREQESPLPSLRLSTTEELPSIAACRQVEPRRLSGLVRGELDWIVMKALEKDRTRRYETASALAADLRRYLDDEPVQACPPSLRYRFYKFTRRNRAVVVASAAVAAALFVGAAASIWQAVLATRAEGVALIALKDKDEALAAEADQRRIATINEQAAIAREAETKAVLDFVEGRVFAAARPEGQYGGQGKTITLRKAALAALPFVQQSFRDQPLIEARLRTTLATSFWYLGDAKIAAEQVGVARAIYTEHRGVDHPDTLQSTQLLANCYDDLGRHDEAVRLREETLALRKAKLGATHPDTLRSMNNLANSYSDLGRKADALKLYKDTLALMRSELGPEHPDTLRSMHNVAVCVSVLGQPGDAHKLLEETMSLRKATLGPGHPDTLQSMSALAANFVSLGRPTDALKLGEETLALQKATLGPDHLDTLNTMDNLANSYFALGRQSDGLKLREEILALRRAKFGIDHRDTLKAMDILAGAYVALGRPADALKLREATLSLRTAAFGPDNVDTLGNLNDLAAVYHALHRYADAVELYQKTLGLMKAKIPDHRNTLICMGNLATSLRVVGRPVDAVKLGEEALALQKAKLGPDNPDTLRTMVGLANSYAAVGRDGDALELSETALPLMKARLGRDDPDTLACMGNLANKFAAVGRHDEAINLYQETLALRKVRLGPKHPQTIETMNNLAKALQAKGRVDEAIAASKEVIGIEPSFAEVYNTLGIALAAKGQHDDAIAAYNETIRLQPDFFYAYNNLGLSQSAKGRVDEAIAALKEAIRLKSDYVDPLITLGAILCDDKHDYDGAIAAFSEAIRLRPENALAHRNLGNALAAKGRTDAAVVALKEAIRLKPDYAPAHDRLGAILCDQKHDYDGAIAAFTQAIRLQPEIATTHRNLGIALRAKGRTDEALGALRQAIRLKSDFVDAHLTLGAILCDNKRDFDGAIAAFSAAIRFQPKHAVAHFNMGNVLRRKGRLDEAIAAYQQAVRIEPNFAAGHSRLGIALADKGQINEAIAEFRQTVRLQPDNAEARCNLGGELLKSGQFQAAVDELRRGHELGSRLPRWRYPSEQWLRDAERQAELEARLPNILKGRDQPADAGERMSLAVLCQKHKALYAAAERWFEQAFASQPALAEDLRSGNRYNAACAAALAGTGRGKDAPAAADPDRPRFRQQALSWLRADLAAWSKLLEGNRAKVAPVVRQQMQHWLADLDFASVRGSDALAKLPEAERPEWQKLWTDVENTLAEAGKPSHDTKAVN